MNSHTQSPSTTQPVPVRPRGPVPRLAYLVSQLPALSHTFILREITELRRRGFSIRVASINAPDRPPSALTHVERTEAGQTYYVKRAGIAGALAAHAATLVTHPAAWLRGAAAALRLGGADARGSLLHFFYFTEALMVARWMRQARCTHLHVHFASAASTVALIVHRAFATPFSVTVHGPDEFYAVDRHHLRQKVEAAAFVLCIGHYARSQLQLVSPARHWHKIEIARLGVDPTHFTPARHTRGKRFEILCVGRLVAAKGQFVLIDAARKLVADGGDVTVRFVGNGPDRDALAAHIRNAGLAGRVRLEGGIDQDRIGEFYARADCFVLASFAEGIPVVLMEAMAMGVPCVTTRITGIPELIRDGIDGLLVAPSDSDSLAAAIADLMRDPALCRRLAANARATVVARYNLERNTGVLADILHRRLPLRAAVA
jgi:colanic acid/amylovoran biosynthesis glycosyltransferase